MLTSKHYLSLLSLTLITACGSSDDDYRETILPPPAQAPAPTPPTPVAVDFPVQANAPTLVDIDGTGTIFTTDEGLSLYLFSNDEEGVSNCNADEGAPAGSYTDAESCAGRWPPLLADDTAVAQAPFSFIERADGTSQWAYQGFPVYQFIDDRAQGDTFGEGLGGVWHVARPRPINNTTYLTAMGQVRTVSISSGEQVFDRLSVDGHSLYTFDVDSLDTANCFDLGEGSCIDAWPPVLADAAAKPSGLFGVAEQSNGLNQWTFRGKPLYLFANDTQSGDTNGQGAGGNWFLATQKPAIQRAINDGSWLTATGRARILTQDENGDLAVQIADKDQFSLYVFANDEPNVSNCTGGCLGNWPAFLASDYDNPVGAFGIIEREDGYRQWTFDNQPLYFFAGDNAIDDTNGQGVGDVWWLIPPAVTEFTTATTELGESISAIGSVKMLVVDESGEFAIQRADKTGFQLYTFDVDDVDASNCTSLGCIGNWPALLAQVEDVAAAPFSFIEREDGYRQWAINNKPLYFFTPDEQAGDQFGESVGDVWWVARSAPVLLASFADIGSGFVAHRLDANGADNNDESLEGFTLYTFDNDVADSGESVCTGNCANVWPPLYANGTDQAYGEYGIIERENSDNGVTLQWTYRGKPLYFFTNDNAIGDANGQGVNGFRVAVPNE